MYGRVVEMYGRAIKGLALQNRRAPVQVPKLYRLSDYIISGQPVPFHRKSVIPYLSQ